MRRIYRLFGSFIIVLYFFISVFTLGSYGTNWDELEHLMRGQAYLNFFLTGKEHYDQKLFEEGNRYSFYQMPQYDFAKWKKIDAGHPVLSGIVSSFFNYVFYQQLGIINDFDSYHLYGPVLVTLFLIFLFFWVERYFGGFAALVSVISLITYPLFYGESHFNVQKDIPEAVFYSSAIMTFFIGYTKKSVKWIVLSALFFGFAWGTKFNILFMPIILLLWLIVKEKINIFKKVWGLSAKLKIALILYPFIGFSIFFFSWPFLWDDSVHHILEIFGYYKDFGVATEQSMPPEYYIFGFNTYALQWIMYTTPLVILFLSFIGISYVLKKGFKEKDKISFLILIWFLFPILRVTVPNTSIYGGVRQIMEYIPPMAILAGIGATYIVTLFKDHNTKWFKKKKQLRGFGFYSIQLFIVLLFVPIIIRIILLFPNESVYFNPLVGGLKGAAERNLPGWGNALGSTYKQGVEWLNTHAEKNARVVLLFANISNIPQPLFRKDIKYSNTYRSGPGRQGEYVIGVTHYSRQKFYHHTYVDRFLDPVYEVKVDSVPILKVWKNDLAHTKPAYRKEEEKITDFQVTKGKTFLRIDLKHTVPVSRIQIRYNSDNCTSPTLGHFEYSIRGDVWRTESGDFTSLPFTPWLKKTQPEKNILQYIFAAGHIRFIRVITYDKNSCLLHNPVEIEIYQI